MVKMDTVLERIFRSLPWPSCFSLRRHTSQYFDELIRDWQWLYLPSNEISFTNHLPDPDMLRLYRPTFGPAACLDQNVL